MSAFKKVPHPTDKHVGDRVRMRRLMLGISQSELADTIGLSFQQVQKYEKGTNRLGASRLQHIAHILQVSEAFFFEAAPNILPLPKGTGAFPSPDYVFDFLATSDGRSLVKAFMQIKSSHLRQSIVSLVEQIADSD